jgi:flavin-dependent dehydrogenase
MHRQTGIVIIGGGLAGLTAALHLQREGLEVLLIEKAAYPHHKVCGEYVSNEVLPYLQWLDADPLKLNPALINTLSVTTLTGKTISSALPLGGFGISRYTLDNFMYQQFINRAGATLTDTVTAVSFKDEQFEIITAAGVHITAAHVIGAYGKRSAIDKIMKRAFIQQRSPFLAVKAHYNGNIDCEKVSLYNFTGGYCGVSQIEDRKINICYLADYATFRRYKDPAVYQREVLFKNKQLKDVFDQCKPLFEKPLSISQLSFGSRSAVTDHILMIGDTAGLIHPLCGNGMAMAIHSAKLCAEVLILAYNAQSTTRRQLETTYSSLWEQTFRQRLSTGAVLSALLKKDKLARLMMGTMAIFPSLLPIMIKKTHGVPLTTNSK